jgi:hypothetical protein
MAILDLIPEVLCPVCSTPLSHRRRSYKSKWCSYKCRREAKDALWNRRREVSAPRTLSTGQVGAIAELIVAADLLKRGYEVFRAVAFTCSCDLVALKNGRVTRIEVKSATRGDSPNRLNFFRPDPKKSDVVAVVIHRENLLLYIPELATDLIVTQVS